MTGRIYSIGVIRFCQKYSPIPKRWQNPAFICAGVGLACPWAFYGWVPTPNWPGSEGERGEGANRKRAGSEEYAMNTPPHENETQT